jgi:hypothetical protein
MHEVVICTSAEHDWGSHIGCNFDRMFVGEIWCASCGQDSCKQPSVNAEAF